MFIHNINNESLMYFVHSYYVQPESNENILTRTNYAGFEFCSSIKKDNIFGFQFHPEKSGKEGLMIYDNFLKGTASTLLLDYPVRADEVFLYNNNADSVEPQLLYHKVETDGIEGTDFPGFYNMNLTAVSPFITKIEKEGGRRRNKKTKRRNIKTKKRETKRRNIKTKRRETKKR